MNELQIQRAAELLRKEFGPEWQTVAGMLGTEGLRKRVGKELTSFMAFPERGSGGSNAWRGNCSPEVPAAILRYVLDYKMYYGKDTSQFTFLDPMSGSGSSKIAAERFRVRPLLYDLNPEPAYGQGNWNALRDEVGDSADLIFFHPPYHNIINYSGSMWGNSPHPDDLSRCGSYGEFLEKLNYCIRKFFLALRKDGRLAVLVGDIRYKGQFYSIQNDMMRMGDFESFVVKSQFNCVSDSRAYRKPFIPIVTEYMMVMKKEDSLMVSYSCRQGGAFSIADTDITVLTWHHLIRMTMESTGGQVSLKDLYSLLASHPKARNNAHYRERIRATIYEHGEQYLPLGNGHYKLNYEIA